MLIPNDLPTSPDADAVVHADADAEAPTAADAVPPAAAKKKSRARKTSTKPTRIYSYRILPPTVPEHRKLVDDQFFLAHQYRSRLIEIEIELRANFRAIDLDHPLTHEAYSTWEARSAALDAMYTALRAAKSGKAPEQRQLDGFREALQEGKRGCSKAWSAVKSARANLEVKTHHQPRYSAARERAATQRLEARAAFSAKGLMHGTYIRIEQAVERSVDSTGHPPKFLRYEGEGLIGRQLPRTRDKEGRLYSVTAKDLYTGADTRVRMTPLPDGWEQLPRAARRRIAKHYRSVAKRQPHGDGWQEIPARLDGQYLEMQFGWKPAERPSTWVRFPLTHHRRLPEDAEILWVHVCRWRVGIHYEWRVQLTIESDTFHRPTAPTAHAGACAIDIGWRRILDDNGNQVGLRVAYLVDEHGHEREIRAPDGLWQRLAKVYSIAQIRARSFDRMRDCLVAWTAGKQLPQWFVDRAKGLPQWRAQRKLQRLVDTWKEERGWIKDEQILTDLLAWAKQDRHLATWEAHQRDRTIANRREVWRQIAAELARTYQTILVEDGLCRSEGREGQLKITDIDGWDKLPPEEGDPHEGREQRRQSRMAAPGELRLAIAQAVHKTASTVIDVARAKNSTRACAWCGHVQERADFAASIKIQCEDCRRTWDQDANAARNLLHRRGLTSGTMPPIPVASGEVRTGAGRPLAGGKGAKQRKKAEGGGRQSFEEKTL
jgi:hypothetical protein